MPKIKIHIEDTTGSQYNGDEVVVFVPGNAQVKLGLDSNNCVYIAANSNIEDYLTKTENDTSYEYTEALISYGFDVVYQSGIADMSALKTLFDNTYLKDKNAYNIKYLTSGVLGSFTLDTTKKNEADFSITNKMISIAQARTDCVALIDYAYTSSTITSQKLYEQIQSITDAEGFGAMTADWGMYNLNPMPGSLFYLIEAGKRIEAEKRWDAVSGVNYGVVASVYSGNCSVNISKYDLDNYMEPTSEGNKCFNGIVQIRPYGYTIWGDRTLKTNTSGTGLKAMSFLSLRILVCDICKRVYESSIKTTFESNNDITWMNYKTNISELIDKMVADGKLANYQITKITSDSGSEIKCKIKIVPNEPVEDFDVYVNITNGTTEVTEG